MSFELWSEVSPNVISSIVIVILLSIIFIIIGKKVEKLDPKETPKGLTFVMIQVVDAFNGFIKEYVSPRVHKTFGAYFFTIIVYLALANTISLFGMAPPLANLSVAFAFIIITFVAIKITEIKFLGLKNKAKSIVGPVWFIFPISVPTNLIGEVSTPFSMGLRLFVNLFSGLIMSTMVFAAIDGIQGLGQAGVFGISVVGATLIHLIFDIFFGLIQAFVFFMLTIVNISLASEA